MYQLRDKSAVAAKMDLIVFQNPEAIKLGINPFDHGEKHTQIWKTDGLKIALDLHKFDVAFGGARRDEEKSRAKERIFSFRTKTHQWNPKAQHPELWSTYNTRKNKGDNIRVFPLSNWTELDVWHYIFQQNIEISTLYFAKYRPTVIRDKIILMVDDNRFRLLKNEKPKMKSIRFRTLGCYPLTGAIESSASTISEVINEISGSKISERQGRIIDSEHSSSMELKKKQGYF